MSTFEEFEVDFLFFDHDAGGAVDEVAKEVPGVDDFVTVGDAAGQESVETTGDQRQLQIAIHLHSHRPRQYGYVKTKRWNT